ncbi:cell division protein ZipA [Mangrovimicrobium sediminis]|uniref:Cell division protein ZipA n=1 Tax=Mangrovimicrobium sediminis TaxID=2562682 RepID=A0A4Z0M6Q3_9GAMM|nr:cell division protein ZipA [Haliea sp. SAOS-164]TGD75201.1 cell division protein ZipA [Haliea sp. SAOS-164]
MAELTIRDWMVIIGVLLIVAVLLDAWRRVRNERRSGVRMKLQPTGEEGEEPTRPDDLSWLKELPNGGARVVRRGDLLAAQAEYDARQEQEAATDIDAGAFDDEDHLAADLSGQRDDGQEDLLSGLSASRDDAEEDHADAAPAAVPLADDPGRLPRSQESEVFMLNVVARDPRGFRGEDILHILLACDLRFGDMNFFHRHEFEAGKGAIQFSVANMMQPGVFDIDNMGDFNTPGLVFFLTLPGPEDMMKAFDYMLETAQAVARNLGGDVLDESRSVLTRQTLEHSRQLIRDLERRLLARAR